MTRLPARFAVLVSSPTRRQLLLGGFVALLAAGAAQPVHAQTEQPPRADLPLLEVGTPAPDFKVTAHNGEVVQLSKLKGKNVVLYFYPKDDTPGCTKEACDFRDAWGKLQSGGVKVYGISTQDNASHQAFAEKHKLPFPLLPDEKGEIAAKYHVPVLGGYARRITYLVGKDGKIRQVWPQVQPEGHAGEILAAVKAKPAPAAKTEKGKKGPAKK